MSGIRERERDHKERHCKTGREEWEGRRSERANLTTWETEEAAQRGTRISQCGLSLMSAAEREVEHSRAVVLSAKVEFHS